MTIIAWDGKTMAADRGAWRGAIAYPVRKVFRMEQPKSMPGPILVGIGGHSAFAHEVLAWMREGGPFPTCPDSQRGSPSVFIVDSRRHVFCGYADLGKLTLEPVVAGRFAVFGAPICEAVAVGCLSMGGSARTAVKLAMKYTDSAALGIDEVKF